MEFIRTRLQSWLIRATLLCSVYAPQSRQGLAQERLQVCNSLAKCVFFFFLLMHLFLASLYSWMEKWKKQEAEIRWGAAQWAAGWLPWILTLGFPVLSPIYRCFVTWGFCRGINTGWINGCFERQEVENCCSSWNTASYAKISCRKCLLTGSWKASLNIFPAQVHR